MDKPKNRYTKKGRQPNHADPFEKVVCFVPRSVMGAMKITADTLGIPVQRLLVRHWLYNTIHMDLEIPAYQNETTVEQQQKLYEYLSRANLGVHLDLLVMAHEDAGFDNEITVLWTLRDLLNRGVVKMFNDGEFAIPKVKLTKPIPMARAEKFLLFAGKDVNQDLRTVKHKDRIKTDPGGVL